MPLKDVFDGFKRPSGKWMIAGVATVLFGGAAISWVGYSNEDTMSQGSAASMSITPKKEDLEVGGRGTEQYNKAVIDQSHKEADQASKSGKSFAPPPVSGKTESSLDSDVPNTTPPKEHRPQNQQEVAALKQSIKLSLQGVMEGMTLSPQGTMNFIKPERGEINDHERTVATKGRERVVDREYDMVKTSKKPKLPGGVHAGSILYAVNDLKLNSDGKNTVVRATVISGPLKGYSALGSFEHSEESMSIVFSRLVSPTGQEYSVKAFGIAPDTAETNVASDVDHHYLSRWGGFMAASFLQGFADATRLSGVSTGGFNSGYPGGYSPGIIGYGFSSFPTYSLADKGIIAAGEAGRAMAQELKEGVKRPPTVTLDPGIAIGILIVDASGS